MQLNTARLATVMHWVTWVQSFGTGSDLRHSDTGERLCERRLPQPAHFPCLVVWVHHYDGDHRPVLTWKYINPNDGGAVATIT